LDVEKLSSVFSASLMKARLAPHSRKSSAWKAIDFLELSVLQPASRNRFSASG
jgi:hypothetical protein